MDFKYQALDVRGVPQEGTVSAASQDAAIGLLQGKGLTITAISGTGGSNAFEALQKLSIFNRVSSRQLVMLSRQIATLFEAQVSALRAFRLLAEQAESPYLRDVLVQISDDLQGGNTVSVALAKHPDVFSDFYVNMVRAGEESGKLDETFLFLADHVERAYEISSKVRNALIYPGFILATFVGVMVLMLVFVIPKIGTILSDSGQELPFITSVVLGLSAFFVDYGIFLLIALIVGGYFVIRYAQTPVGKETVSRVRLTIPYVGNLYRKLFLSRIADNMHVMLSSGITAVRALEITAVVVNDTIYSAVLTEVLADVKAGSPMSQAFAKHGEFVPPIMVQMLQIGEETGALGNILERLAKFYSREVNSAVDTLVSLVEPALIIMLALGVGFLLASVLMPIYNTANAI